MNKVLTILALHVFIYSYSLSIELLALEATASPKNTWITITHLKSPPRVVPLPQLPNLTGFLDGMHAIDVALTRFDANANLPKTA